ncbi:KTSC domain-containing protein [Mesorhizobium sp. WSM4313]|uniref:KTSC domain-containing protein n=1 Tax=Mesorhizobium sp. WSM4313 TaxID=2029412 RepID=UPI000BB05158|nr:KTSC domain-containing protein [Mesorhizobium sp. WSM4313]PBB19963.1 KTSC domain-containing protein [Mesorhizobium sp. WSM4313]
MPSTAIRTIHYDPSRRVLSVWFVPTGKRYDYEDVGPEVYTAFKAAFSKGQFFNEFVRDRFRYHLVEHEDSACSEKI